MVQGGGAGQRSEVQQRLGLGLADDAQLRQMEGAG